METTTTRASHPEIQQKMAAIMAQDERAKDFLIGFAMAYEMLHPAEEAQHSN